MDSVELARQIAAELHARLVASGADPWSPYEFTIAEATRRYPQLTFLSVNGEALPLADESVDLVLFFTVFSSILD